MGWGSTAGRAAPLLALTLVLSACESIPWLERGEVPPDASGGDAPTPAVAQPRAVDTRGVSTEQRDQGADSHADLWRHIGIELRLAAHQEFRSDDPLARFGGGRTTVERAAARARSSLAHIVAELERRELPHEIALIPIIESSYNPLATSPSGAAGIWQLMPATARRFGLNPNRWYDPRRDIVASTQAALDYFELLRDRFMGDWPLVFAAYNCGEHTVERAIARNAQAGKPTRFDALELPAATEEYVPRLFALAQVVAEPARHGVTLPVFDDAPFFVAVDVGPSLALERVRELAAIEPGLFRQLNAGYRLPLTPVDGPSRVLVPPQRRDAVIAGVAAIPAAERQPMVNHTVSAGETLSHIALASGVSVATLKRANRLTSNRLSVGQLIRIPAPGSAAFAEAPVDATRTLHVVVSGDNLWNIARRYGSNVKAIAAHNGIAVNAVLAPGQKLRIPGSGETPRAPDTASAVATRYQVRRGDSLWTIARRFEVSVADLKRWNAIGDDHRLMPGDELVVTPGAIDVASDS